MPVVNVYVQPSWLPGHVATRLLAGRPGQFALDVRRRFQSGFEALTPRVRRTPKHVTTLKILAELPGFVAAAVNRSDGESLTPDKVIVVVHRFHPGGQNLPDMWIDIQPEDRDLDNGVQCRRRMHIAEQVVTALNMFFQDECLFPRPNFDVECRPLSASGMSVNYLGFVADTWGEPKVRDRTRAAS